MSVLLRFDEVFTLLLLEGLSSNAEGYNVLKVRALITSNCLCRLQCEINEGQRVEITGSFVRPGRAPRVDVTVVADREENAWQFSHRTTELAAGSTWGNYTAALAYFLLFHAYKRGSYYGSEIHTVLGDVGERGIPTPITVLRPLLWLFELSDSPESSEPTVSVVAAVSEPGVEASLVPCVQEGCWFIEYLSKDDPRQRETILRRRVDELDRLLSIAGRSSQKLWESHEVCRLASVSLSALDGLNYFNRQMTKLRRCWLRDGVYDEELGEFLGSDEAMEVERQVSVEIATGRFTDWLENCSRKLPVAGSDVGLEMLWTVEPTGQWGDLPRLTAKLHLTTDRLFSAARNLTQLRTLLEQAGRGGKQLSAMQTRLTRWFVENLNGGENGKEEDVTLVSPSGVLEEFGQSGLLFWAEDRSPVLYSYDLFRLTVVDVDDSGEAVAQWAVTDGGGNVFALSDKMICVCGNGGRKVPYAKCGNTLARLDCGTVPVNVLHSILTLHKLPLTLLNERGLGTEFLRQFVPGTTSAVEVVPVQTRVVLRTGDKKEFHLTAFAYNRRRRVAFAWMPSIGWLPVAEDSFWVAQETEKLQDADVDTSEGCSEEVVPAQIIGKTPQREDVVMLESYLGRLIPLRYSAQTNENGVPVITFSLNSFEEKEDTLRQLWEQRPTDSEYMGDMAFQRLVSVARVPRLNWSVSGQASGINWLDVSVDFADEMPVDLAEALRELSRQNGDLIRLDDGRNFMRQELTKYCDELNEVLSIGIDPFEKSAQRIHAIQASTLQKLVDDDLLASSLSGLINQFTGIDAAPLPPELAGQLRSYQREGVDFIVWACRHFGGALLADDMGLGKTLQVLSSIVALRSLEPDSATLPPSLVVCPASVVRNWQREAQRFVPGLRVLVLESGAGRKEQLMTAHGEWDVIVMNYALTRFDTDVLHSLEWFAVCADEAQVLKNPDGKSSRLLRTLPSRYRIALTGTPVENRLLDLWAILAFAIPGFLPMRRIWTKQIAVNGEPAYRAMLRAKLKPVVLRRLKTEVASELPARIEEVLDCELLPEQKRLYLAELKRAQSLVDGTGNSANRVELLTALMRLRQICCHPWLVSPGLKNAHSGKLSVLVETVSEILEEGHKVLVFSQFVQMLNIIAQRFDMENIPYRMLTGETKASIRADLVSSFEESTKPEAFLISLKAGGVGLNLASASYVIIYDPWWNPAVEAQAIDRVHRIGQHRNVVAMRLVNKGTIEERVLELQEQKRELFASLFDNQQFSSMPSQDDLRAILHNAENLL